MNDKRKDPLVFIECENPYDKIKDIERKEKLSKKVKRLNKLTEK